MKAGNMGNQDYEPAKKQDLARELDEALDAALAKYAAAEPRTGLEERILASLRASPREAPVRSWWRWSAVAAAAAVVIIASVVAWRSSLPSHPAIAKHPSATIEPSRQPPVVVTSNGAGNVVRPQKHRSVSKLLSSTPAIANVAGEPKLDHFPSLQSLNEQDQFPSPRPLSEQERILASYVSQFPTQAVLMARAQTELLEREEKEVLEKYGPPPAGVEPQNRQPLAVPNL